MQVTDQDDTTVYVTLTCQATTLRIYAPGHDAKDKSLLIAAHRAGKDIRTEDGVASALQIARAKGWEEHILHERKPRIKKSEVTAARKAEADAMVSEVGTWLFPSQGAMANRKSRSRKVQVA
jgi:hypothetical protein